MNTLMNSKKFVITTLLLAAAMAATRVQHFGSAVSLSDASLAVFFLAGFYLQSVYVFPLFLAGAALIDYAASVGGVSDWCITPAYPLLIPAYAALWFAGRWYAPRYHHAWRTLAPLATALLIGTSVAFLISNGSFYFVSGYFGEMSLGEYAVRVTQYYPLYVANTLFYVALAAGLHLLVAAMGELKPERSAGR